MAKLLSATDSVIDTEPVSRVGGLPLAPSGFEWPQCASCRGPMQFLAQLPVSPVAQPEFKGRDQLLLLFQCGNQPGMCDDWDADSGGNRAVVVQKQNLELIAPPVLTDEEQERGLEGETTLDVAEGIELEDYDDSRQEETGDDGYVEAMEDQSKRVVGKLGGTPLWSQGDETPQCSCGEPMTFVAQLEYHAGGGINFGDNGTGYAFACSKCDDRAKFLWQG